MKIETLHYALPKELIAQLPLSEREASRLLVVDTTQKTCRDEHVRSLPNLLKPALWVLNDTRVIPARILGRKATGGRVEILLIEPLEIKNDEQRWLVWSKASKALKVGDCILADRGGLQIHIQKKRTDRELEVGLKALGGVALSLEKAAVLALPPYIERAPLDVDEERYQTVYASEPGAIAAPTAGLHFSESLMNELELTGHRFARVTLHVGPGTFAPLKTEDLAQHAMHEERFFVPESTAQAVHQARQTGTPVIAVGTTVVRVLESAYRNGELQTGAGSTSIFIYPPYTFQSIDALFTNFHLPRSTLLALVMAWAGTETVQAAYAHAVQERYRFFSYGDAMLLAPRRCFAQDEPS